jgi:hypothetical protein
MKGTILDFLKLATEKPELTKELVELATKYDFEFSDEVGDADLDAVAGGLVDIPPVPLADISIPPSDLYPVQQQLVQMLSNLRKTLDDTADPLIDNAK